MGFNSQCKVQNCKENCCNHYGYCPQPASSSTFLAQCTHYYNTEGTAQSLSIGLIAAITIGSVFGIVIIILFVRKIYLKCQTQKKYEAKVINKQVNMTDNSVQYKEGNETNDQNDLKVSKAKLHQDMQNQANEHHSIHKLAQADAQKVSNPVQKSLAPQNIPIEFKLFPQNPLSFIYIEQ